jgi:hypothetical protein
MHVDFEQVLRQPIENTSFVRTYSCSANFNWIGLWIGKAEAPNDSSCGAEIHISQQEDAEPRWVNEPFSN